ncbi:hypothetical protein [Frigoriflavimonas asaccharolytica]|uniref:Lipoprotein n=1 Tax=Frigoriflavimonas asaccharolytica TaxID=2735899 RepID=A0A8J8G5K8_9FLAO|nr:hypothetical protein [Frigoriflavimonas asaccharolytica]NRS91888.1 hypothetical protein [Frigoriflavimonas asaccharolytica]
MKKVFVLSIFCILISCSKISPAKFWQDFHSDLIITENSDQGPFGGTAEIIWDNNLQNIDKSDFLKFAFENGWNLKDSLKVKNGILNENSSDFSFQLINQNNLINSDFKDATIYIFQTDLLKLKADTEISTENNAFLFINKENSKLKMFNIWGE